jgi:hypothetical protein
MRSRAREREINREPPLAGWLAASVLTVCTLDEHLNSDSQFVSSSLDTTSLELDAYIVVPLLQQPTDVVVNWCLIDRLLRRVDTQ